jgi:hypothetical protein
MPPLLAKEVWPVWTDNIKRSEIRNVIFGRRLRTNLGWMVVITKPPIRWRRDATLNRSNFKRRQNFATITGQDLDVACSSVGGLRPLGV